jgi:hypothetical protein
MQRFSRQGGRPLAFRALAGSLVAMAIASGCGGSDTCVIINNVGTRLDWTVTLAVTGSVGIGVLEADVSVEPCSGICDCRQGCGCGDQCDCSAGFSGERAELDCEPLVDATYRGSLDSEGTAHIELVAEESIVAPAEILKCDYRSATEPSPSDFRVVVNEASGPSSERFAEPPSVVIAGIGRR